MRRRTSKELATALTFVPVLAAVTHYEDHIAALTARMVDHPLHRDVWATALTLAANDLILAAGSVRELFPTVKTVAVSIDGETCRVVRVVSINDWATVSAELLAAVAAHLDGFLTPTTKVVLQHTGAGRPERLNLKALASKVSGRVTERIHAPVPSPASVAVPAHAPVTALSPTATAA